MKTDPRNKLLTRLTVESRRKGEMVFFGVSTSKNDFDDAELGLSSEATVVDCHLLEATMLALMPCRNLVWVVISRARTRSGWRAAAIVSVRRNWL